MSVRRPAFLDVWNQEERKKQNYWKEGGMDDERGNRRRI